MERFFTTLIVCLLVTWAAPAAADGVVRIGTGGIAGTYYPVGRTIAELINRSASLVESITRVLWSREGRRALIRAHSPIGGHGLAGSVRGKALAVHPGVSGFLDENGILAD